MTRDRYQEELDQVIGRVLILFGLVENAIERASRALLDADRELAEDVISADVAIDAICREIEGLAIDIQMRQQPVAGDLRLLIAVHRIVADLERSGDLAKNIAKQVRRRHPEPIMPDSLRETIRSMAQVALELLRQAHQVFADRDPIAAARIDAADDQMDALHRTLLVSMIGAVDEVETAVELTLIGRFYERYADHAVAIAEQVVYLATGEVLG